MKIRRNKVFNPLKKRNIRIIFFNPYSPFIKSVGYLIIIFSFQFPWYCSHTYYFNRPTIIYYHVSQILNAPNVYFCFILLGVFGGFLLNCLSLVRKLNLGYIHLTLLALLELILVIPMMCYPIICVEFYYGYIWYLEDINRYFIQCGYYINVFGNLILLLDVIIKRGLISHYFRNWKYNSLLIRKLENIDNTIQHLHVKRVSVNPKILNSCMNSTNS